MTYPTEPLPLRRQRDQFDRERLADEALRKKRAKHRGRNHWRNWERRLTLLTKQRGAKAEAARHAAAHCRHKAQVRAYWLGQREAHP